MLRSSIFYTFTFIFVLAIVSISLAILWLMEYDKKNYMNELNTKYSVVARANLYKMNNLITNSEFQRQTENFEFSQISNETQKDEILKNGEILDEVSADIGSSAIIFYKKKNYLKISTDTETILLNDKEYQPHRYDTFKVIYLIILSTMIIAYIFIIRKIKPLRKLKREIDKFAKGDLQIKNVSQGSDEISQVSQAFYDSVMQINKLNESRHLFLRNIMHELKTPITKGRIAVEMIEKGKNQERLISVFERLENLINEFAAVERATSGIKLSEIGIYGISEIINESLKIAMVEREYVEVKNPQDINLKIDFKLFCIAVKNIIDNGIKYSPNKKVKIVVNTNKMEFRTLGEPLNGELDFYTQAFSKGKNAKQSFGLGLYIVDNILKSHGLKFAYYRDGEENVFAFENLEKIVSVKYEENLELIDAV